MEAKLGIYTYRFLNDVLRYRVTVVDKHVLSADHKLSCLCILHKALRKNAGSLSGGFGGHEGAGRRFDPMEYYIQRRSTCIPRWFPSLTSTSPVSRDLVNVLQTPFNLFLRKDHTERTA